MPSVSTRERLLDAALSAIARRGVAGASLAEVAREVGVTKAAVLYHFDGKDSLLLAAVDRTVADIELELRRAVRGSERGWPAVERQVRAAFGLAARRPEALSLLREVARAGPPVSARLAERLGPMLESASSALRADMDDGLLVRYDPQTLLLTFHAVVVGVAVDSEVMRAVGVQPSVRSLVDARRELLALLGASLDPARSRR